MQVFDPGNLLLDRGANGVGDDFGAGPRTGGYDFEDHGIIPDKGGVLPRKQGNSTDEPDDDRQDDE